MAEFTPNFNLKKPYETDFFNIEDFNGNMDIIDQKLKEVSQNEQLQGDVTEIKGTTEEIKTSVGSSGDLSSSPTLFGRLAEIKETLTSKFSEVVSKITGVDEKIGTSGDSGTNSVFGKLNSIEKSQTKYITASDTVQEQLIKDTPISFTRTINNTDTMADYDYNNVFIMQYKIKKRGSIKLKGKVIFSKTSSTGSITDCTVSIAADILSSIINVADTTRGWIIPAYKTIILPPFGTITTESGGVAVDTTEVITARDTPHSFEFIIKPFIDNVDFYLQTKVTIPQKGTTTYKVTFTELNICYDEVTE